MIYETLSGGIHLVLCFVRLSNMSQKTRSEDSRLLVHAVDAILNRIRVLAREMCPADCQKLEDVIDRAFADLSQIAAVGAKDKRDGIH
jgi:hypothetical protein